MCLLKWSFGISSVTSPKLLTSIAFISPKIISGFSLVEISFLQCAFKKQDNKYLKEHACKVHIGWIHGKAKLKVAQSNYCEAFDILFFGSIIWSEWNTIPVSCPERFPVIFINTFFFTMCFSCLLILKFVFFLSLFYLTIICVCAAVINLEKCLIYLNIHVPH